MILKTNVILLSQSNINIISKNYDLLTTNHVSIATVIVMKLLNTVLYDTKFSIALFIYSNWDINIVERI